MLDFSLTAWAWWLVVTGVRVGDLRGCWYCVERKRRKQPCLRKRNASGQWPSWRDRGLLLEKQEARISRTCQATHRPLAPASAHSHSPRQSSALLSIPFGSSPLPDA